MSNGSSSTSISIWAWTIAAMAAVVVATMLLSFRLVAPPGLFWLAFGCTGIVGIAASKWTTSRRSSANRQSDSPR